MKRAPYILLPVICAMVLFSACKKETENFRTATLQEYFPIQIGNTWIYELDSIMPAAFGTSLLEKTYHAKDTVIATFIDFQGRLSYVIHRFTRDVAGTQPWTFATTIHATPANQSVEYIENNLRFVKLATPLSNGFAWYGHAFIDTYKPEYSHLDKRNGWNYTYENVGEPYTVLTKTYDSTATVAQNDDTSPPGPFDPNQYQQRMFGVEVFAKNVGLIYKDFIFWTWQNTPPPANYQDDSYGIRLRLISHK